MSQRLLKLLTALLLITTLGCNVPSFVSSIYGTSPTDTADSSLVSLSYVLATTDPNASPTVTPFQPLAATATATTLPTFTPTNTPLPTATPLPPTATLEATHTPKPADTLQVAGISNVENILILGTDQRSNIAGFRTDVILWVSINPKKGTVSLISFPRDLWVYIPGYGDNRINTAMYMGFSTLQATFKYNFGITPDHYVMTSFDGFKTVIDTLGGIDVDAAVKFTDVCDLPENIDNLQGTCTAGPGITHMNGAKALWYVRSRETTSDLDRTRRTQEVVVATFKKLMSLNAITNAAKIYSELKGAVSTDLSFTNLLSLAPMALQMTDLSKVKRYYIGAQQVYNWTTPGGAMVLVPIQSACLQVIQQALNP